MKSPLLLRASQFSGYPLRRSIGLLQKYTQLNEGLFNWLASRMGALTGLVIGLFCLSAQAETAPFVTSPPCTSVVYVTQTATGLADGTSWTNAYGSTQLQLAINQAATCGAQVWVAQGLYKPATASDRTLSFSLVSGVAIYGGFVSGATSLTSRNLTVPSSTTLSGDIDNNNSASNNSYHVVVASSVNSTARLDGFVITGGTANGTPTDTRQGAGGRLISSSLTVVNCQFVDNQAEDEGGGVYASGGSPQFINCVFQRNRSNQKSGGGLFQRTTPNSFIRACVFTGNSAAIDGGGFYSLQSDAMQITDCRFSSNTASVGAGAWEANYGVTTSTVFTRNQFTANVATNKGGGLYADGQNRRLVNCVFWNNRASTGGGGVHLRNTSANAFTNCVWSQNTAPVGSWLNNESAGSTLTNCIAWGNSSDEMGTATFTTVNYSDIAGWAYQGTGNIDADPLFVDAATGDLRLAQCSPAIDLGDPASSTQTIGQTDLGGNTRIQGGRIDMGAYEFTPVTLPSSQSIVYVSPGGSGSQDGSSWANALPGLQCAINLAGSQGRAMQVWVAEGLYKPTSGTARSVSFELRSNVSVYGGFAIGASSLSARNLTSGSSTTLSGNINSSNSAAGSYNVLIANSVDNTVRFDGFVITGGQGTGGIYRGSGIQLLNSSPTIANCQIGSNTSEFEGGGVYVLAGNPQFMNCLFKNNSSQINGGGLFLDATTTTLTSCTFSGNQSYAAGGGVFSQLSTYTAINTHFDSNTTATEYGGGLYSFGDVSPQFIQCRFTANYAFLVGGGMSVVYGAGIQLQDCQFTANRTDTNGGGFASFGSDAMQLTGCQFTSNTAAVGGGVWEANYDVATATIYNRIQFRRNIATDKGAGLYGNGFERTLFNCLFANNEAANAGGGVNLDNTSANRFTNCTWSQNTAPVGSWFNNENAGSTLTNCIAWNNGGTEMGTADYTYINYSNIAGWAYQGTGNIDQDPLFVDATNSDFQLSPCSPVINLGDPASNSQTIGAIDLAGNTRIYQDLRIDMGAYEMQAASPVSLSPAVSSDTACVGSTISLTALAIDGTPGYSYTWASPAGANLSSPADGSVISATLTAAGQQTFTVTIADANNCRSTTVVSVTAIAVPSAIVLAALPALTICSGASLTLTASDFNATTGTLFTWSNTESTSAIMVSPASTTAYSVTATNAAGCQSATTITVTVNPAVTVSIGGNLTIDFGSSTTLTASGASGLYWSTGETTPAISVSAAGVYSVTGTSGVCSASAEVTVTVNEPVPLTLITSVNSATLCVGSSVTLSVLTTGGTAGLQNHPYSYTWVAPPGATLSGTSTSAVSATATTDGVNTFTVVVAGANGSVVSTTTVSVMVKAFPIISIVPESPTITLGSSVTLTASGGTDGYVWSANAANATSASVVVNSAGTYSVTGSSGGCSATASVSVTTAPCNLTATVAVNITPSQTEVCQNAILSLTAELAIQVNPLNSGGQARQAMPLLTYRWLSPEGAGLNSTSSPEVGASFTSSGVKTFTVIVTDANNCTAVNTVSVTVKPLPTVTIVFPQSATVSPGPVVTVPVGQGLSYQVFGGVQYNRIIVIDRLNGFEIRTVKETTDGIFPLDQAGPYSITVTGANGCQRTVTGVIVN